jgi:hypothetical protein
MLLRCLTYAGLQTAVLWCALAVGCGGGREHRVVRIDSLATDGERLMLVRFLPPGTGERDVRLMLPALGAVDSATGVASQPFTILGQPAMLEARFRGDTLSTCGFALRCTDSALAAFLYRALQRSYTMDLGNYHETFGDGERPARSYWSSPAFGLVLTLGHGPDGFRLSWHFEDLPPDREAGPPATGAGPRNPA